MAKAAEYSIKLEVKGGTTAAKMFDKLATKRRTRTDKPRN